MASGTVALSWATLFRGTLGAQARMVPDSVAQMNRAGAVTPSALTVKPGWPSNTLPVGAPGRPPTRRPIAGRLPFTAPLYNVETSVPLPATQTGVAGPAAIPHAFTRLESVRMARPGTSDTRLVWWYAAAGCARAADTRVSSAHASPRTRATRAMRRGCLGSCRTAITPPCAEEDSDLSQTIFLNNLSAA